MKDFLINQYKEIYKKEPENIFFASVRVNFIGEHIDYNGGKVVPFAIHRGIYAAVSYHSESIIRMKTHFDPQIYEFSLNEDYYQYKNVCWFQYPLGVLQMIKNQGYILKGCDIYFYSDLPVGSGLSSSAAIEILTAYVFYLMVKAPDTIDKIQLALFCQQVENHFIGVKCGIMDQFSVAMGKKNHLILLDTHSLEYEYLPFDFENVSIVIVNTNKPRTLSGSEYNIRREESNQALSLLKKRYNIKNLVDADESMIGILKENDILYKRARHVVSENRRVNLVSELLKNSKKDQEAKLKQIGKLLYDSHFSLKDFYEVSCRELDVVVEKSKVVKGVYGARMIGAGFGGCVVALMRKDIVETYQKFIYKEYYQETNIQPEIFEVKIYDGVRKLNES